MIYLRSSLTRSKFTMTIEVQKTADKNVKVDLLPFSIEYQGVADISTYFHPMGNTAAFRGRKITARDVSLGERVQGVCVSEIISDGHKSAKKPVKATKYSMDDEEDDDNEESNDDEPEEQPQQSQQSVSQVFQSTGHSFTDFRIWMPDDHVAETTHPLCRLEEQQKLFTLVRILTYLLNI